MYPRATRRKGAVTPVAVDLSSAMCRNGDNLNDDNSDQSGDRLRQNGEKATSQNGDNESLNFHGLKKLIYMSLCTSPENLNILHYLYIRTQRYKSSTIIFNLLSNS